MMPHVLFQSIQTFCGWQIHWTFPLSCVSTVTTHSFVFDTCFWYFACWLWHCQCYALYSGAPYLWAFNFSARFWQAHLIIISTIALPCGNYNTCWVISVLKPWFISAWVVIPVTLVFTFFFNRTCYLSLMWTYFGCVFLEGVPVLDASFIHYTQTWLCDPRNCCLKLKHSYSDFYITWMCMVWLRHTET